MEVLEHKNAHLETAHEEQHDDATFNQNYATNANAINANMDGRAEMREEVEAGGYSHSNRFTLENHPSNGETYSM